jgi:Protein of unknown function (DUF1592)/Protein of unknown function (DUF1588)/Protein of unknown function (DUF1587)/Protein of unknown function (DUF1595)/Protein of unknown function (DUF1585)
MRLFLAGLFITGLCCSGDIVGGGQNRVPTGSSSGVDSNGGTQAKPSACQPNIHQSKAPVRRMTRWEYDNTVFDLLGDDTHPSADFGAEEEALGFNNIAEVLVTNNSLAEKYLLASEKISTAAVTNPSRLSWLKCDFAAPQPSAAECAQRFVSAFGKKAFRRPLTAEESQGLMAVYAKGAMSGAVDSAGKPLSEFAAGLRLVIQAALNAPAFLYRLEWNAPASASEVSGYELASRLSYLLWGSMPDEALFQAVENGTLITKTDVAREAQRLLADPKARRMVTQFHTAWLDFDRAASVGKSPVVYPQYSAALGAAMQRETEAFIEYVSFGTPGTFRELLTAPYSVVDSTLATHYALSPVPAAGVWQRVDSAQRVGLLSQGALMAFYGHFDQTSPVHRGKLIRENFLCQPLQPPPPDVNITVPPLKPNSTTRERFAQHSSNPACSGCHALMDPIGFAFENFDSIGRYREREENIVIDTTGSMVGSDVKGTFVGLNALGSALAGSAQARSCYVTQWFRFAYGRGEDQAQDACALEQLNTAFESSGGNIKSLLLNLTQSDAFLYRNGEQP